MNEAYHSVLRRYDARAAEERRMWQTEDHATLLARIDELLLDVGKEVAELLQSLVVSRNAQCLVELGTSYGYSTLHLAEAARRTGGTLHTFEIAEQKQLYARAQIEEAGLGDHVQWHLGDAVEGLRSFKGDVDFVLIDLWKDLYVPCFEAIHPKLADGAIIAADNILFPDEARADGERYRVAVRAKPDMESVLLTVGSGIELSCCRRRSA